MMREIGSNFWLSAEIQGADGKIDLADFGICDVSDQIDTSTGRSAESIIVSRIVAETPMGKRTALVPPFTCHTVIDPLLAQGFTLYAYPIDKALNMTAPMLRTALIETNAKVVLLHRYFGFDTLRDCASVVEEFSDHGVTFIEDHTQSMYSGHEALPAQYHFGSFRKWLEIPDGGFAASSSGRFGSRPTAEHRVMIATKLKACREKHRYMQYQTDDKDSFLKLFQEAERLLDSQDIPYRMAEESRAILAQTDKDGLRKDRRRNYSLVHEGLKGNEHVRLLMPELTDKDVPLFLVITVDDRAGLQAKLKEEDIFAPILWPRPESLPDICDEADYLYSHALCLPIDQRYGEDDMLRVVECVNRYADHAE